VSNNYIHNLDGIAPSKGLQNIPLSINNSTRKTNTKPMLSTFTEEESYYIPVFIKRSNKQMARLTFVACEKNVTSSLLNPPLPNTPDITVGPGKNAITVNLTWGIVNDNATSYEIYLSSFNNGPFVLYSTIDSNFGNNQIAAVTNLTASTPYYFYVKGRNWAGKSENSNKVSYTL